MMLRALKGAGEAHETWEVNQQIKQILARIRRVSWSEKDGLLIDKIGTEVMEFAARYTASGECKKALNTYVHAGIYVVSNPYIHF